MERKGFSMKNELIERAYMKDCFGDIHIMDVHCHLGSWYSYYFPNADIDEMIKISDKVGVEKLCIAPHASLSNDYKLGNRLVFDSIEKFPDRVWGLLCINGNKPDEIGNEFESFYSHEGFVGLKVHPSLHRCSIADDGYYSAFEIVKHEGGFVLVHSWDDCSYANIERCEKVIRDFPEVPFVLAHAGGINTGVKRSINLVNKYQNAFIDTSGFEFSNWWIEEIVLKTDHKKILFGSDTPFHDMRSGLSRIIFSGLDDKIKISILRDNFKDMILYNPKRKMPSAAAR